MAQDNLVDGLLVSAGRFRKAGKTVCELCVLEKQTRKPLPASSRKSSGPFDLIHKDVYGGPMQTKTPGGKRYFVSFIDDYSWCAVIQLLENKNQVKTALSAFNVSTMETQFDKKVKTLRSDRGGEFWNKEVQSLCASKGIVHQKTNPYSSQENGVAERLNRTLMEKARAMLQGLSLSEEYWGEADLTANYVRNWTVSQVHGKTPLELLIGKKPRVENLRVFGSIAYVHVPQQKRKKLYAVTEKGVFLGYEANTKGYWVLTLKDQKIMVSKDVTFVEKNRAEPSEEIWDTESGESALPGTTSSSESGTEKSPAYEEEREVEKEENEGSREETLDELEGARGLSRVSPLDSPDAGATPTEEASTSNDLGRF
jgi:hypothetical protein